MVDGKDNKIMEKGLLLSICIPTYNRAGFLKENLEKLIPQVESYIGSVEILISDNCSTDNTEIIVNEIRKKTEFPILYTKNEKNIGGYNNMAKSISNSKGKYIYILGDDDILSPDFMSVILRLINDSEEYGMIHFNRLYGDGNCSNCKLKDPFYKDSQKIMPATSFIDDVLDQANFISSIVFNRMCWELGGGHLKDNEYLGYNWFARIYWGAIELGNNCIYYYMPLVIQRNGSKAWIKFWPQYYICSMSNIFFDLDEKIPGIYDKWMNILRLSVKRVIPIVAIHKKYYKKPEIRSALSKHLTKKEMVLLFFYLYFPFSAMFYKIVNFLKSSIS